MCIRSCAEFLQVNCISTTDEKIISMISLISYFFLKIICKSISLSIKSTPLQNRYTFFYKIISESRNFEIVYEFNIL